MKALLDAINNRLISNLLENQVNILSDLDGDLDIDLDIQKKSINNLTDIDKKIMQQSLLSGELTPSQVKSLNNPKNFKRYNALIKVQTKNKLMNLIDEFLSILTAIYHYGMLAMLRI